MFITQSLILCEGVSSSYEEVVVVQIVGLVVQGTQIAIKALLRPRHVLVS